MTYYPIIYIWQDIASVLVGHQIQANSQVSYSLPFQALNGTWKAVEMQYGAMKPYTYSIKSFEKEELWVQLLLC